MSSRSISMAGFLAAAAVFSPARAQSGSGSHPCADSSLYAAEAAFWADAAWEDAGGGECDAEESLLFPGGPDLSGEAARARNRASFSLTRGAGGEAKTVSRQQGRDGNWSQRVELRDDTLTRRRIGWRGAGWKLAAGDLDDPELPVWPSGLPRRALPSGWRPAQRPREAGQGLSSPLPQGFAAGILQPRWKAWAARAWNPVETGDEPSWHPAWSLRHASTGVSLSLPWTLTAQFTDTRVTRADADSLAEQTAAASVASPREDWMLLGAISRSAQEGKDGGWALATAWRHRFAAAASLEVTARQRSAAWESSWDPAVTKTSAAADEDSTDERWGAGEFRARGRLPIPWEPYLAAELETWRAWNPRAATGRQGMRGRLTGGGNGMRFALAGTERRARAASGSVSLYRYLEAETRLEENPRTRLSAFRAWNGSGPTRTGLFFGVEPAWVALRATSGVRVETDAEDRLTARGSLGGRWAFARGWNLDAAAAAPWYPRWNADETRWRVTVNFRTMGSHGAD